MSPVSIYGGEDLRKRWVLSPERKREVVIDGENGGDDSVDPSLTKVRRCKTKICRPRLVLALMQK